MKPTKSGRRLAACAEGDANQKNNFSVSKKHFPDQRWKYDQKRQECGKERRKADQQFGSKITFRLKYRHRKQEGGKEGRKDD